MAMLPPAPGLFSTTNCWPSPLLISAEKARATMEELPPGAKGTIRRIGLVGYVCAGAAAAQQIAAANTANFDSTRLPPCLTRPREPRAPLFQVFRATRTAGCR